MEYRLLGRSGLKISVLTLGTMTFGGAGFFAKTGSSDVTEARRLIDIRRDAGINLIDTADVYSKGLSEEITGEALDGVRQDMMVATKARLPMGDGPNDRGLSRRHLQDWGEPPIYDEAKLYDTIEVLVEIAEARKVPAAQVAMAWSLDRPAIASLVIGVRNEDQFKANLLAVDLRLTAEERGKLDAISAPTLIYPYWHQASTARDRLGAADLALLEPFVRGEARF